MCWINAGQRQPPPPPRRAGAERRMQNSVAELHKCRTKKKQDKNDEIF